MRFFGWEIDLSQCCKFFPMARWPVSGSFISCVYKMVLTNLFLDKKGTPLDEWLSDEDNLELIYGKRVFYILKANLDLKIFKFGIATNDRDGAFRRLVSYLNYYGFEEDNAKQKKQKQRKIFGIQLYGLWGVNYNSNVEPKNSAVARKENYIKSVLKDNITSVARGSERTSISLDELIAMVSDSKFSEDIVTDVSKRRSKREGSFLKDQGFYQDEDKAESQALKKALRLKRSKRRKRR